MNPERWQKLDELFHSALEHQSDARVAFLAAACDRDDELLQELESMLTHHQQAEDFMELPAYGIEAQSIVGAERSSQTLVGKTLCSYDVISELGRGGMGDIYLAFDKVLHRKVALKFLRDDLTADKPRLHRFNQEARAASALNHPNILTIYEAGEFEGLQFIATEFVEGRTLREVMSSGQLNVGQILDIANQIASALLTAHSAGIVHRDIKPENVMARPDGYIKIVDFGVAKLIEKQTTDDNEPTAFKTERGVTVGTVCYMSPEQVRALEVDERTDVWSLGVVLYEMLAGKGPFEGETSGDVIANILKSEPTPLLLPETPGWTALKRLIEKAIAKDRTNRYHSMAELLTDLREIKLKPELMPQVASITGNKRQRSKGFLILLIGLMSSLLLVGGYRLYRYREQRGQSSTVVHPSQMTVRRFTTYGGLPLRAVISPDGRSLAYIQRLNNKNSLWLGEVDTNISSPLYQQADLEVVEPTFAPDGNSIYFLTAGEQHPNGMLKRMSVLGGDVIDLIPNVQTPVALSADGRHIAMLLRDSELKQTSIVTCDAADGRNQQTLVTRTWPDDFTIDSLTWSPDGQRIGFSAHKEGTRDEILAVKLADRSISRIGSRNWATVDDLLWLSDGSLLAVANQNVGERRREIWLVTTSGEPRQITNDQNIFLLPQLSVSANGRLIAMHGHIASEIWIAPDGEARHARRVLQGVVPRYEGVDGLTWTPDQRLLYTVYVGNSLVIWSMDRDGSNLRQLTKGKPNTSDSYVSATVDGRFLTFQSNLSGELEIWRANVDGGDLRQLTHGGNNLQPSLSPDGHWVIYTSVRDGKSTLWRISIDGSDQKQLTNKPSKWPQVSHDGKYIAYVEASESKSRRLAIMTFAGGEPVKTFAVAEGGLIGRLVFRWTPDSKGIIYRVDPKGLWRQDLESEKATPVRGFEDAILQNLAWSLDGKNLAYTVGLPTQEIMLIENFK